MRTDGPTSEKNDTDRDGIPDVWERQHGLDPADPSDSRRVVPRGASPADRHAGYTYREYYLNELADSIAGVDGDTYVVTVKTEGSGLVVCEHGGTTRNWGNRLGRANLGYQGKPLHVAWGRENTFHRGSAVALKALPQESLGVAAPVVSQFDHWSGGPVEGVTDPEIRLKVDRDMTITAVFRPKS
jgi:hypothetical protein